MLYAYSIMASCCAISIEAFMRTHQDWSYWLVMVSIIPLIIVMDFFIWKMLHTETMLNAFFVWSMCTSTLRLVIAYYIGDPISAKSLLSFSLIISANIVKAL